MKKSLILLFILITVFINAQTPPGFEYIELKDQYSINIPEYLNVTQNLNNKSTVQYSNNEKGIYLYVIDESKTVLERKGIKLNTYYYSRAVFFNIFDNMTNATVDSLIKKKGKVINTIQCEMNGLSKLNGMDRYYKIAIFESPTHFYQIVMWSGEDIAYKIQRDFIKIVNSFKEL